VHVIKKLRGAEPGTVAITFELDPGVAANTVAVAGDFNGWSTDANPMERRADGGFHITVLVAPGREYRFRYVLDGDRWVNAWDADDYAPNDFGGEDSVVRTNDISN
jgi:1,4-alpha-glucan branching enzyme